MGSSLASACPGSKPLLFDPAVLFPDSLPLSPILPDKRSLRARSKPDSGGGRSEGRKVQVDLNDSPKEMDTRLELRDQVVCAE